MLKLPAEGYQGEYPEFPLYNASRMELERWAELWRFPQAAAWVNMYIQHIVARYVRDCLLVENDNHTTVAIAHLHSEIRQIEDRLGLSPLALRRLSWEISTDEVEERREAQPRRRLIALESDNAAEA
jgi:hypothetical protein